MERLARLLLEAGPTATSSVHSAVSLFKNYKDEINVSTVAQMLAMMARTQSRFVADRSPWNAAVFAQSFREMGVEIDWDDVIAALDAENVAVYDLDGLAVLISAHKVGVDGVRPFPTHLLLNQWKHPRAQISIIRQAVFCPRDLIDFCGLGGKVIDGDTPGIPANMQPVALAFSNHKWNSIGLFEALNRIVDGPGDDGDEIQALARDMLSRMAKTVPEVTFLGLFRTQDIDYPHLGDRTTSVREKTVRELFLLFLAGQPNSALVLAIANSKKPGLVEDGLQGLWERDANMAPRILDVAHDLRILTSLLQKGPISFSLELAAIASRREYLNLDKWLHEQVQGVDANDFYGSLMAFLARKIQDEVFKHSRGTQPTSPPLSLEVWVVFLRFLERAISVDNESDEISKRLTPDLRHRFKDLLSGALQMFPRLMNVVQRPGDDSTIGSEIVFSAEIEKEVNTYYERMYSGDVSVEQMLDHVRRLHASQEPRHQLLFACIIHNLFDEYRFYGKYPEKELGMTAALFGSLMRLELINPTVMRVAFRYVLDALGEPSLVSSGLQSPSPKMLRFAIGALKQCKDRLSDWPGFCRHLQQHVKVLRVHGLPEIASEVQRISATASDDEETQKEPRSEELVEGKSDHSHPSSPIVFPALRKEAYTESDYSATADLGAAVQSKVRERILFIINNLDESNAMNRTNELIELLGSPETRKWFSHYLVVTRVGSEPNQHELYHKMLDRILVTHPSMGPMVLRDTYKGLSVLLNSSRTADSSRDRQVLKNLGSWLGGRTLAKDRPILLRHVVLKDLLIQGHSAGRMIVAMPFVCAVLAQCENSKVFKPKNPWLMAILRTMVELYFYTEMKINMRFEVEVLFRRFGLQPSDLQPTNNLRNRETSVSPPELSEEAALDGQPTAGFSVDQLDPERLQQISILQQHYQHALSLQRHYIEMHYHLQFMPDPLSSITNLAEYIAFNPIYIQFVTHASLRQLFIIGIDRAFREVMPAVVKRAKNVAGLTTNQLILKDFALEPNEEKMRKAAYLMCRHFAGHMALAGSREGLKSFIEKEMRGLLSQNGWIEDVDEMINGVIAENIDFLCHMTKMIAAEKAVGEIEDILGLSFSNRRKHRERTGTPFYDMATYNQIRELPNLPPLLHINHAGGLTPTQLSVYDEFARDVPPYVGFPAQLRQDSSSISLSQVYDAREQPPNITTDQQITDRFQQYVLELDLKLGQNPASSWRALPENHQIRAVVSHIVGLIDLATQKDAIAWTFSQKVVHLLFKCETDIARETYVILLACLCDKSNTVLSEVKHWLIYADDERKFNVPVTLTLIRENLINAVDLDLQLSKLIEQGRLSVAEYAVKLIRQCVLSETPIASRSQFANTVTALMRLANRGRASDSTFQLLDDIGKLTPQVGQRDPTLPPTLKDQLSIVFSKWVALCQQPSTSEAAFATFIGSVQRQGVFDSEESQALFFRICTESAVAAYTLTDQENLSLGRIPSFAETDALAKLVVLVARYYETTAPPGMSQAVFLKTVLTVVVLVMVSDHQKKKDDFRQDPYFAIFGGILDEIASHEAVLPQFLPMLISIAEILHSTRPTFLPAFSYAWLALVSHRNLMPRLLLSEDRNGWACFHRLVIDMLTFLSPFLMSNELSEPIRTYLKGFTHVLTILRQQYPTYFAGYWMSICDALPENCIYLRNLVLSSSPPGIVFPDPLNVGPNVIMRPEFQRPPLILGDTSALLDASNLRNDLDEFLRMQAGRSSFLQSLCERFKLSAPKADGLVYNVPLMNAFVFYVGVQDLLTMSTDKTASSRANAIYNHLALNLDLQGRYHFLNAIANHLRWPNPHTFYFGQLLLRIFAEIGEVNGAANMSAPQNAVDLCREQIGRVLIERLSTIGPHPWGLVMICHQIMRNERFQFWQQPFIRCSAEIAQRTREVAEIVGVQ